MNIVIVLWHSIEEYDQLRLLTEIGHNVYSIGAYSNPHEPGDDKRPALPDVPYFADLHAATNRSYAAGIEPKQALPPELLDWADIVIYHHRLEDLYGQWNERIAPWLTANDSRRVIWRTVGQSVANNEAEAAPFRNAGMEVVRYSPKEANIPGYVGADALIRFCKDPDEWTGWTGEDARVINITQHLKARDPYTNWRFWEAVTEGFPRMPLGPGSEDIGGTGPLTNDEMKAWLRRGKVYLYTGTQPASYTLGLIEAMMTGIPIISIAPQFMGVFPYGPDLFEGHEIAGNCGTASDGYQRTDEQVIANTRVMLGDFLGKDLAWESARTRARAIELFGIDVIREQWRAFLG